MRVDMRVDISMGADERRTGGSAGTHGAALARAVDGYAEYLHIIVIHIECISMSVCRWGDSLPNSRSSNSTVPMPVRPARRRRRIPSGLPPSTLQPPSAACARVQPSPAQPSAPWDRRSPCGSPDPHGAPLCADTWRRTQSHVCMYACMWICGYDVDMWI